MHTTNRVKNRRHTAAEIVLESFSEVQTKIRATLVLPRNTTVTYLYKPFLHSEWLDYFCENYSTVPTGTWATGVADPRPTAWEPPCSYRAA